MIIDHNEVHALPDILYFLLLGSDHMRDRSACNYAGRLHQAMPQQPSNIQHLRHCWQLLAYHHPWSPDLCV